MFTEAFSAAAGTVHGASNRVVAFTAANPYIVVGAACIITGATVVLLAPKIERPLNRFRKSVMRGCARGLSNMAWTLHRASFDAETEATNQEKVNEFLRDTATAAAKDLTPESKDSIILGGDLPEPA